MRDYFEDTVHVASRLAHGVCWPEFMSSKLVAQSSCQAMCPDAEARKIYEKKAAWKISWAYSLPLESIQSFV